MKRVPNTRGVNRDAVSNSDFLTSDEERGFSQPSHSLWFPVVGIALIVLLLLFVSLGK